MDPFTEGADALSNAHPEVVLAGVLIGILAVALAIGLPFIVEWLSYRRRSRELDEVQAQAELRISAYVDGDHPSGAVGDDAGPDHRVESRLSDAAYERKVRDALAHAVTLSYEHPDGTSSEVKLDPTSVDSIERFLKAVRQDNPLRGRQGEPATPAR